MTNYTKEVAILGLVAIEICALIQGVNGVYLSVVIGAISGLAGFAIGSKVKEEETS